jgi:hypothetical protein
MKRTIFIAIISLMLGANLFAQNNDSLVTDFKSNDGRILKRHGDYVLDGATLVLYLGNEPNVVIPAALGITRIEYAFSHSKVVSITVPEGVKDLNCAFDNCDDLISVAVPNSVTSIKQTSFYYCPNLASINVAANNTAYSSVNGVLFNKPKTLLVYYPPAKSGKTFDIPASVNFIEDGAFSHCSNLESITIPKSVIIIPKEAFEYCSSLVSVTIPDSVIMIGDWAFHGCISLSSITIPNSVLSIGYGAFRSCTSLLSITIPNSVENIDGGAFYDCSSLKLVRLSRNTEFKENTFPASSLILYNN